MDAPEVVDGGDVEQAEGAYGEVVAVFLAGEDIFRGTLSFAGRGRRRDAGDGDGRNAGSSGSIVRSRWIAWFAGAKSWLEEIALVGETEAATPEVMTYVIHGGSVTFRKGVRMTRAELKRLLQEM